MNIVFSPPCEPNADWTLQQLEEFIHTSIKQTAEGAYRTGKALKLARRKVKEEKVMTWTQWKEAHNFSDTTVSRYIRLFESYESVEALGNLGVIEACEKAGIVARGKKDRAPSNTAQANEPFAWAIDENEDQLLDCLADLDNSLLDVLEHWDLEHLRNLAGHSEFRATVDSVKHRIELLQTFITAVDSESVKHRQPCGELMGSASPVVAV